MIGNSCRQAVLSVNPRTTLLAHTSGIWEGAFVRLAGQADGEAAQLERFTRCLLVEDWDGMVQADLANLSSGTVRSMAFAEPPAEMQISADGHWSLGRDRIGAWLWVCELCLAGGERRRRAVVRLKGQRLVSLVVVIEARLGCTDPPLAPPWRLPAIRQAEGQLHPAGAVAPPAPCLFRLRPAAAAGVNRRALKGAQGWHRCVHSLAVQVPSRLPGGPGRSSRGWPAQPVGASHG